MRPNNLKTKIFLDGGNPNETREIKKILGFLDGQTTNPTLIARNPEVKARLDKGEKFSEKEILDFYKDVVQEISSLIPNGSVSIEVYADARTPAEEMFLHGRNMFAWIPNAHIKYPTTKDGLKAAEISIQEGLRVNMTLVFSQGQAAAVYAATKIAKKGGVFLSPFVGRLDDQGENGMELIENILRMYTKGDGHVEVLTASVRSVDHMFYAIALGSDIITAPFAILKEWGEKSMPSPSTRDDVAYARRDLIEIPYEDLTLEEPWTKYEIHHELTDKGIGRFSKDWKNLIA